MRLVRNFCAGCLMLAITYVLFLTIIVHGLGSLVDK